MPQLVLRLANVLCRIGLVRTRFCAEISELKLPLCNSCCLPGLVEPVAERRAPHGQAVVVYDQPRAVDLLSPVRSLLPLTFCNPLKQRSQLASDLHGDPVAGLRLLDDEAARCDLPHVHGPHVANALAGEVSQIHGVAQSCVGVCIDGPESVIVHVNVAAGFLVATNALARVG